MKRIFTLLLLSLAFGLNAQERYLDEIFDEVQVTEDVQYAANITVITALQGLPPLTNASTIGFSSCQGHKAQIVDNHRS